VIAVVLTLLRVLSAHGNIYGQSERPILSLWEYQGLESIRESLGSPLGKAAQCRHHAYMLRYTFLAELLREDGTVVHCRCCDTNVARVQGVTCLVDLDKPSEVTLIDTIDEVPPISF
jgi:hypothetical protein